MKKLALLIIGVLMTAAAQAEPRAFIIVGQSNTCGRGDQALLTRQDRTVPSWIKYTANRNYWEMGITNYISTKIGDPTFMFGTEVQIKNRLVRASRIGADEPFYIIKSCGIQPIHMWQRGNVEWARLMETIVVSGMPPGTKIEALDIIQGEADRSSLELATTWHTRIAPFIIELRKVLNQDFPVIYTQIGIDVQPAEYVLNLRESQAKLPTLVGNVHMVDTSYLPKYDGLHYTNPHQLADLLIDKYLAVRSVPARF